MPKFDAKEQQVLRYLEAQYIQNRSQVLKSRRGASKEGIVRECELDEGRYARIISRLQSLGIVETVAQGAVGEFLNIDNSIVEIVRSLNPPTISSAIIRQAIHVRAFIAGPSDVENERTEALDAIVAWNAANSFDRGAIIEPVSMKTHARAEYGDHPQEIIDRQLLDTCTLLIAIFRSTIGNPTNTEMSGTVQEIKEFIAKKGGEHVLLFFSKEAHPPDVDTEKLEALRAFKKDVGAKCLYVDFQGDFGAKLAHQLDLTMNKLLKAHGLQPEEREAHIGPKESLVRELKRRAEQFQIKWQMYEKSNDEAAARRFLPRLGDSIWKVHGEHVGAAADYLMNDIGSIVRKFKQHADTPTPSSFDPRHFWTVGERIWRELVELVDHIENL